MPEHLALRATLQNKLTHLQQRLGKVEQSLRQTPEPDSEERASGRENDEVLERLDESDREEIRQLQEALARVDAGTYGLCTICRKNLAPERLAALPYARTCITCAREPCAVGSQLSARTDLGHNAFGGKVVERRKPLFPPLVSVAMTPRRFSQRREQSRRLPHNAQETSWYTGCSSKKHKVATHRRRLSMSTKARGRGNVRTRRNLAEFDANDPYTPRFAPEETAVCTECHALYERRHWFCDEEAYFHAALQPDTHKVLCPACQKIRDGYAEGQVTLRASAFLSAHKDEIRRIIHNEEARVK